MCVCVCACVCVCTCIQEGAKVVRRSSRVTSEARSAAARFIFSRLAYMVVRLVICGLCSKLKLDSHLF